MNIGNIIGTKITRKKYLIYIYFINVKVFIFCTLIFHGYYMVHAFPKQTQHINP